MNIGLIQLLQEDKHPAPAGHPESAHRIKPALEHVLSSDISKNIKIIRPEPVETDLVYKVHDKDYLERARSVAEGGGGYLDGDTYMMPGSYEAAMETASAAIYAVDSIMSGDFNRIFSAGRPPGHHAEYSHGMGFCVINNTALAAEAFIERHNLNKIAIVDWDVHHGNGTQHHFYERADVYFISLHQYPFYPGSGASTERGRGEGEGFTLNFPMPAGSDDASYARAFEETIVPELEKFKPQAVIITSGFDAHREDPLASILLSEDAYTLMTRHLTGIADKYSRGRILSFFEGGYNPSSNARSLYNHLKELQED